MTANRHADPEYFSTQTRQAERFFLGLTPDTDSRLAVVAGGVELCAPDYAIQRHSFPFHGMEFVAAGEGVAILGGRRFELGPGCAFAYGTQSPHELRNCPERPLRKYFVDFAGSEAAGLLAAVPLPPGVVVQMRDLEALVACWDLLVARGSSGSVRAGACCTALLRALAALMADSALPYGTAQSQAFISFQRCRDYCRRHFLDLQEGRELAAACHVDMAYMCRLFQRFEGRSPYQYLLRLKMNHAANLLRTPGARVKDVAIEAGGWQPGQFSRAFKKVFGVSPQRFVELTAAGGAPAPPPEL